MANLAVLRESLDLLEWDARRCGPGNGPCRQAASAAWPWVTKCRFYVTLSTDASQTPQHAPKQASRSHMSG
eukprot:5735060-Prymnesium_polylepis.1